MEMWVGTILMIIIEKMEQLIMSNGQGNEADRIFKRLR